MCLDGGIVPLLGMALQGASTLSNMSASRSQGKARNAVNLQEQERQRAFQSNADAVNSASQEEFTRQQQDARLAQEVEARNKILVDAISIPPSMRAVPTSPDAPGVINSQIAASISKALGYGKQLAGASAKLGAYGGAQFGNNLTLARSGTELGRIGGDSARSSDNAGLALEGANQAGAGARQLGDLFRVGGQGLSLYGMTRPAARAPAPTPGRNADAGITHLSIG
jgi:hypothetical protein